MSDAMDRRDAVRLLAFAPLAAAGVELDGLQAAAAHAHAAVTQGAVPGARAYRPKTLTPDEYALAKVLADYVIPRDARSGSASDAGVPPFMDFMLGEHPSMLRWMRDGQGWLNGECRARFGEGFLSCDDAQRRAVLDDIAYPATARAELKPGVEFFSRFRDLTASGFWSSRLGVKDLDYRGNVPMAAWRGCPSAQLRKLGVDYRLMDRHPRGTGE